MNPDVTGFGVRSADLASSRKVLGNVAGGTAQGSYEAEASSPRFPSPVATRKMYAHEGLTERHGPRDSPFGIPERADPFPRRRHLRSASTPHD